MINRLATKTALRALKEFPVVAILGPRQVGKTTLARQLVKHLPAKRKHVYFDLESHFDSQKLRDPELLLQSHEKDCVVLDEIQHQPELFSLMRSLVDKNRIGGRFILTGSSSPSLMKKATDSLAGRIFHLYLDGFNYHELEQPSVEKLWFYGGFPKAVTARNAKTAHDWIDNFIHTYVHKDLPQIGFGTTPQMIERFWHMLAHYHGGIWNATNFGNALGVSNVTVSRYIDYMEGAFLINRLQPFAINTMKRLVKAPKIYLRDSGVLHRLNSIETIHQLKGTVLAGHSWEGFVIEQIRQLVKSQANLFYYRTHAGAECDLVLTKGLTPYVAIEIKHSSKPNYGKGFKESITELKTKNNFIIVPHPGADYPAAKNIIVAGFDVFMNKYLKKLFPSSLKI